MIQKLNDLILDLLADRIAGLKDDLHCPVTAKCTSCNFRRKQLKELQEKINDMFVTAGGRDESD